MGLVLVTALAASRTVRTKTAIQKAKIKVMKRPPLFVLKGRQ